MRLNKIPIIFDNHDNVEDEYDEWGLEKDEWELNDES